MTVPAWAAREWRSATRDLCERILDHHTEHDEAPVLDAKHEQRLLLRADKVVAKLYSHRYMDVTPQQIAGEVEQLAAKMDIHLLPERASKLRSLASRCEYRVVKMLIELADAPTRADDTAVALDTKRAPLEALQAWNRLLTPSKEVIAAEAKAKREAALVAQMETELLQVAWQDDWWKERMEDDDASELNDVMDSEMDDDDLSSEGDFDYGGTALIGGRFLLESADKGVDEDDAMGGAEDGALYEEDQHSTDAADEDEDDNDDLLLQYYPQEPAKPTVEAMEVEREGRSSQDLPRFSFNQPNTLLSLVEQHGTMMLARPREVIHERVIVDAIFYALHGIPSSLFERTPAPQTEIFHGEFVTATIAPSSLLRRGVVVSHLSPLATQSVVTQIATHATRLQFLRDLASFLAASPTEDQRSTVAEGLACRLQLLLHAWEEQIDTTQRTMQKPRQSITHDPMEKTTYPVVPTLLGVIGSFTELFATVEWLQASLVDCLAPFQSLQRQAVSPAKLSSTILSRLFQQITVSYVSASSEADDARNRILCTLFAGALTPYLDAVDEMLFSTSYADQIPLHRELFFVAAAGEDFIQTQPHDIARETFDDAMATLIPFRVDAAMVPVFLESLVPVMSAALESRQILNRYHHQTSPNDPDSNGQAVTLNLPTLAESFRDKFVNASEATAPFTHDIHVSVVQHIEQKCVATTGGISNLFRRQLRFREHLHVLRLFLLMHQQDVFTALAQFLIDQMRTDPVGWARTESINAAFQDAIHTLHEDGQLTAEQREIAARLSIRVDPRHLQQLKITPDIDVTALQCLRFKFATPSPLRVLFSGSIIEKYSMLGTLLLQVKLAELMLTNFKQSFRHRLCATLLDAPLRHTFVRLADMLHYTRAVLHYLASQMTGDAWQRVERVFETSHSIREINAVHDEYLNRMLHHFFLLDRHKLFTRHFMETFNHAIAYVSRVDEFVRTVERNTGALFTKSTAGAETGSKRRGTTLRRGPLAKVPTPEFSTLLSHLKQRLEKREADYEGQLEIITVVLDAMTKNGASAHVNELLLLLTFNEYRTPARTRR